MRYGNKVVLRDYIDNPYVRLEEKFITQNEKLEEEIFLGFRRMIGINIQEINNKFHIMD